MRTPIAAVVTAVVVFGSFASVCPAQDANFPAQWDSLDVAGLTALAQQLDPMVGDCKQLAAYVAQRYQTAAAAGQVDWNQWLDIAAALGQVYPAATRTAMAQGIQEALAADNAAIVGLSSETAAKVADALSNLGQGQSAASITATWLNGSQKYKTASSAHLAKVAYALASAGDAARSLLISHITNTYMTGDDAAASIAGMDWWRIVSGLKPAMSAETRASWAARLRSAYSSDARLFALGAKDMAFLNHAMIALGGAGEAATLARWVNGTATWQTAPRQFQLDFLQKLVNLSGEVGKTARVRIAEHLADGYLADIAASRAVTPAHFRAACDVLAKDLSAEARGIWGDKFRTALANDSQTLWWALKSIGMLGDQEDYVLRARWWANEADLQSVTPADIPEVVQKLTYISQLGQTGQLRLSAQLRIRNHIAQSWIVDDAIVRSAGVWTWRVIVQYLHELLTPELKTAWAGRLREVFAASPEVLGELDGNELTDLVDALSWLDSKTALDVMVARISGTEDLNSLAEGELVYLAKRLGWAELDQAGLDARKRLADHVKSKYLADSQKVRLIDCDGWIRFADSLDEDLSPADRELMAEKLKAAYGPSVEAFAALKLLDAMNLLKSLVALADSDETISALALGWLENTADHGPDADWIADIAANALRGADSDADKARVIAAFDGALQSSIATHGIESLKTNWVPVVRLWMKLGRQDKAQQYALGAYEAAFPAEEPSSTWAWGRSQTLMHMTLGLSAANLTGEGKGYPAYAKALGEAAVAGELVGRPWYYHWWWAKPLGTPESRGILEAKLQDPEGVGQLEAAKPLAWAYKHAGQLKAWQQTLDEKIAAAASADAKAGWLLARAYAESIVPFRPSPLRGKEFLTGAMAAGQSAEIRFEALRELVDGYAAIGRHDAGVAIIDSVAGQFDGTQLAGGVDNLRRRTLEDKAKYLTERVQRKADARAAARKGWEGEVRRRIAVARARGDDEEADRLARMLTK